jgi:hypothetical protein
MSTRAIIIGIALFLATGTAHAVELPDDALGNWCYANGTYDTRVVMIRDSRANQPKNCSNPEEGMTINKDGYDEVESECKLGKIEQSSPNTFLAQTRCEAISEGDGTPNGHVYTQNLEIQTIDERLMIVRLLPET